MGYRRSIVGAGKLDKHPHIRIKNARVHNLKGIDVEIPRDKFVVITGVSGSGKSSLAFDTIYAEGYRKYMESLSTRARQVLDQIKRPEVDLIEGLSPVIAIEQRKGNGDNPRSTVATITEIADYSRVLWSVLGDSYCPKDGAKIERLSLDECVERVLQEPVRRKAIILSFVMDAPSSVVQEELAVVQQKGFERVRINGEIKRIGEPDLVPKGGKSVRLEIVLDRIVIKEEQRSRIADSLEFAFSEGGNKAIVAVEQEKGEPFEEIVLSQQLCCSECSTVYPELTTRHFSWNNPDGACEECSGLGVTFQFQEEFVVPDGKKSVRGGAIKAWRLGSKSMIIRRNAILKQLAEQLPFDPKQPWSELDDSVKHLILQGATDRQFSFKLKRGNSKPEAVYFEGVFADLRHSFKESSSDGFKARLIGYQTKEKCKACDGNRLGGLSRHVQLAGVTFPQFMQMPLKVAEAFVNKEFSKSKKFGHVIDAVHGLKDRLHFLNKLGLQYLTLNRPYHSLSGGESQRVRLATQLGMGLVGVVYVLDEPSIGLHSRDNQKLLSTLLELKNKGNSVLVVEHDMETIKAADIVVELGPGAGTRGGEIVFHGTPKQCMKSDSSLTGPYLSGKVAIDREADYIAKATRYLSVKGAEENNLKSADARFPLGQLSVVCGVSGSGKSTLINDVLGRQAAYTLNKTKDIAGKHKKIEGLDFFSRVARVDQSAIGRSPRSNPATYVKLFGLLRDLFSKTSLAKVRGYKSSRFSFNVKGGRCEKCKGDGSIKLDMQFMSDVYVECSSCQGKRYNRETLEVRFKGLNVADILDMTVEDAAVLFRHHPNIIAKLDTMLAVGLGYLKLGQSATTLSGGEAQRIKLSLELSRKQKGDSLYILDEPTTGLHLADIQNLMNLLFRLRDDGNTIILIEHNLDVVKLADWIVELGPDGGSAGGEVVYEGTLKGLLKKKTPTSVCLNA